MSMIHDAVIHLDTSNQHLLDCIRAPLPFDVPRHQSFEWMDPDRAGGSKFFTSYIYAAAFNHISVPALFEWFEQLPWPEWDHATLTVQGEICRFEVMVIARGRKVFHGEIEEDPYMGTQTWRAL